MPENNLLYPAFGKQIANWSVFQKNRNKKSRPNVIRLAIPLHGIDHEVVGQAFESVVRKHESLRTIFKQTDGVLKQVVVPYSTHDHCLSYISCKGQHYHERIRTIQIRKSERTLRDLENGPLFQGVVYQMPHGESFFEFSIHHIIADAWSINLIKEELFAAYRMIKQSNSHVLTPLKIQLKDYSLHYYNNQIEATTRQYWLKRLAGLKKNATNLNALYSTYNAHVNNATSRSTYKPRLKLNDDNIIRVLASGYGYKLCTGVEPQIVEKINRLARLNKTTPSIILLTSFLLLALFLYDTRDVLIVSRFSGRLHPVSHGIIGNFTSAIYSYLRNDGAKNLEDIIQMVHRDFVDSTNHAVHNPLILNDIPITTNCHICANIVIDENEAVNAPMASNLVNTPLPTYFPLENTVLLGQKAIALNWTYNTALFRASMVTFIADEHLKILRQMTSSQ